MEHQNWETFVIHCKAPVSKTSVKQEVVKANHKHIQQSREAQKIEKMEEEGDLSHKKVEREFRVQVQQKRLQENMTQKQLANKLSVPVSTINDIESGKALYDPKLTGKLKRMLKIS